MDWINIHCLSPLGAVLPDHVGSACLQYSHSIKPGYNDVQKSQGFFPYKEDSLLAIGEPAEMYPQNVSSKCILIGPA